jgi:transposase
MYQNFIGIDIGKETFVAAAHGDKEARSFSNDPTGFELFFKTYEPFLSNALVVLETTGGYELQQIRYLQAKNIAVHRANTRKVKYFIKSLGILGKSDAIDAKALARYGQERHAQLELFREAPTKVLQKLVERREDLKKMFVQEKNRLQAPDQQGLKASFEAVIQVLQSQLELIEEEIEQYCKAHPHLRERRKVLRTVKGIGPIVSAQLVALLPELGTMDRKKIASLAGLAPHPYESGKKVGYRRMKGGRGSIKSALYMAAMAASKSKKSTLGIFYSRLVSAGKKKMVALGALMRKILVIANARVRDFEQTKSLTQHG